MPSHWLSAHVLSTLPIFITTNLAAIGIWLLNISEHSMPLILGIIAGGLVDLDNNLSGRFKNLIITLIAFAISSAGATLSLEFGWLFVPLAVLSTFILVMLGSIGQLSLVNICPMPRKISPNSLVPCGLERRYTLTLQPNHKATPPLKSAMYWCTK